MSYWIFVMKGTIIDFQTRMKSKFWPIKKKTGNKNNLQKNDRVVFYLGGPNNMKFMGTATISSELKPMGDDFVIELHKIEIWEKPISVPQILDSLTFIPNKKNWGFFFQGVIVWISKNDYNLIINKNMTSNEF